MLVYFLFLKARTECLNTLLNFLYLLRYVERVMVKYKKSLVAVCLKMSLILSENLRYLCPLTEGLSWEGKYITSMLNVKLLPYYESK